MLAVLDFRQKHDIARLLNKAVKRLSDNLRLDLACLVLCDVVHQNDENILRKLVKNEVDQVLEMERKNLILHEAVHLVVLDFQARVSLLLVLQEKRAVVNDKYFLLRRP